MYGTLILLLLLFIVRSQIIPDYNLYQYVLIKSCNLNTRCLQYDPNTKKISAEECSLSNDYQRFNLVELDNIIVLIRDHEGMIVFTAEDGKSEDEVVIQPITPRDEYTITFRHSEKCLDFSDKENIVQDCIQYKTSQLFAFIWSNNIVDHPLYKEDVIPIPYLVDSISIERKDL